MERFVSWVERIAGSFLLAVATLTFASVVLRYLFGAQIPDWFDFSKLLQGIAIFWGIACVCYRNEHILVDMVWEQSSDAGKRRIDLFATIVLVCSRKSARIWANNRAANVAAIRKLQ